MGRPRRRGVWCTSAALWPPSCGGLCGHGTCFLCPVGPAAPAGQDEGARGPCAGSGQHRGGAEKVGRPLSPAPRQEVLGSARPAARAALGALPLAERARPQDCTGDPHPGCPRGAPWAKHAVKDSDPCGLPCTASPQWYAGWGGTGRWHVCKWEEVSAQSTPLLLRVGMRPPSPSPRPGPTGRGLHAEPNC